MTKTSNRMNSIRNPSEKAQWAFETAIRNFPRIAAMALLALGFMLGALSVPRAASVAIVVDPAAAAPVRHGLFALTRALEQKNTPPIRASSLDKAQSRIAIVAGLAQGSGPAATLMRDLKINSSHRARVPADPSNRKRGAADIPS